ncbi:hypothetical protein [Streptomyces sp. NPDC058657]|uniref:hypothetical protein n=1 Tax=unclassified Streptomyces TaxID=2593676 RepID=UPI0036462E15
MKMRKLSSFDVLPLVTGVVALSCGAITVSRLLTYRVPLGAALLCGVAVTVMFAVIGFVYDFLSRPVFRCSVPDCSYLVRLSHADAAETRRWQESAAAHPDHELSVRR